MIVDTTLFIDLQRNQPSAIAFLQIAPSVLVTTWITIGELLEGGSPALLDELVGTMPILGIDRSVCQEYGRARRYLRSTGNMIGAIDLWIAAIALANEMPVVTRNDNEFGRVPGLKVIGYA